jgi:hypothetical protein
MFAIRSLGKIWLLIAWLYYAAVWAIVPRVSCQWPFNEQRLLYVGLIPLAFAIVGLCVYQNQGQRLMAWILFGLAIAGICVSFQPWCLRIGLNTW